jgi:hypothetical protein
MKKNSTVDVERSRHQIDAVKFRVILVSDEIVSSFKSSSIAVDTILNPVT